MNMTPEMIELLNKYADLYAYHPTLNFELNHHVNKGNNKYIQEDMLRLMVEQIRAAYAYAYVNNYNTPSYISFPFDTSGFDQDYMNNYFSCGQIKNFLSMLLNCTTEYEVEKRTITTDAGKEEVKIERITYGVYTCEISDAIWEQLIKLKLNEFNITALLN